MSHHDNSPSTNASSVSPAFGNRPIDSHFELLEEPKATQPLAPNGGMYWYAASDSTEPIGPVSLAEIRKRIASGAIQQDSIAWCKGMTSWTRISDLFDVAPTARADYGIGNLPLTSNSAGPATALNALAFYANWEPSARVFRLLARSVLAIGLLMIILELVLILFGASRFSGGLQMVLIAAILESTAVIRAAYPSTPITQGHETNAAEDRKFP